MHLVLLARANRLVEKSEKCFGVALNLIWVPYRSREIIVAVDLMFASFLT